MLIKDGNRDRFSHLYQEGCAGQMLPGSGYLRRLVRNVGIGPEVSDGQLCGIGYESLSLLKTRSLSFQNLVTFFIDSLIH